MVVELKTLDITNEGYKRRISLSRVFVNANHIISISDYEGVKEFLLSEGSDQYRNESFSLVKISTGNEVDVVIALGSSDKIYESFTNSSERRLLND